MQQIINFLIRHKNTLLFLLLFFLSIFFTVQSHSYHKSKFVSSTNFLTGGFYEWVNGMEAYFHLEEYNQNLKQENSRLRSLLYESEKDSVSFQTDSTTYGESFSFLPAKIISNNYSKTDNYLLLDKGGNDSVKVDMGVVTSRGIVGIVEGTSENYARVISILNSNSAINVRLKKSNHFGTLTWNGENPNLAQLTYVPKIAPVQKGDTVITGGKSFIFPEGIPVGLVHDFSLGKDETYYDIDIRLFNDMTNLGYVYVIGNPNREELLELSQPENE
jgi:rod shape-determining protein MreC